MNRTATFMSKLSNFEMAVIRNNVDEVDRARLELINFYRDLNREIERSRITKNRSDVS